MTPEPIWVSDTPLGLVWNGRFAVSIFFVLSGFVIAGAAERQPGWIGTKLVLRYLRLALPVFVSVLLAWCLLSIFPTAASDLSASMADPSRWLDYTHQGDIPTLWRAAADGFVGNFLRGGSMFNNVLWTMQIELFGSFGLFIFYWLAPRRHRIALLAVGGVAILILVHDAYLAFVFGALLYEAHMRAALRNLPIVLAVVALIAGVVLGAPGPGWSERWGLDFIPEKWMVGYPDGVIPVLAATFLLCAILKLPMCQRALSASIPRWLGRISFSLYLVHVPLLYTLVAFAYVRFDIHPGTLAALYGIITLTLAHYFTIAVDLRVLTLLKYASGISTRIEANWRRPPPHRIT